MIDHQGVYEKPLEMSTNDDYTTVNLFYSFYHEKYYKLIDRDLSIQKYTSLFRQTDFVGKLEEDDGPTMVFYC